VKRLLTGNEAIARGAWEAGVHVASGCEGEPSGTILETLSALGEVAVEPAPWERAAVEVALGAALAGGRGLAAVPAGALAAALDALDAASASGAAGLVVVACDDPSGRHAPPADSRPLAREARAPVMEPADPAECREAVAQAFELSERFETPVVVRLSTRLADSAEPVEEAPRRALWPRGRGRDPAGAVALEDRAAFTRVRGLERLAQLAAHALEAPMNRLEMRSEEVGVVTSGLAYGMVREVLPEASVLKLGLVYPVPSALLRAFAGQVRRLQVVEELEPFLESELRAAHIACEGKNLLGRTGEITPGMLARALRPGAERAGEPEATPVRSPELCPGCPYRALGQALKRLHVSATVDPGCRAFPVFPTLGPVDRAPGRGAAAGVAHGLAMALGERIRGRDLAALPDGALLQEATGALALAARGQGTVLICDVGGGGESGSGVRAPGGWRVDPASLLTALGFASVRVVDALDLEATTAVLRQELARRASSAVVARAPCTRWPSARRPPMRVDPRRCNRCGACLRLGCPAIFDDPGSMVVSASACAGCGLCAQVCRARAIEPAEGARA
jgi:indolepyruvate ferredoxin oxidoreductase alpha subunit